MKHIILASVLYPTKNFDIFINDLLTSIKQQTYPHFSLLFFLDGVQNLKVERKIKEAKIEQKIYFQTCKKNTLTPSQIRHKVIQFAQILLCDLLIFCDFDEKISPARIEQTINYMHDDIDFSYCNAYITDKNFNLTGKTFFQDKNIPNTVECINPILEKNFIGMGGLALKLHNIPYLSQLQIPSNLLVFDWFLATYMLLKCCKGKKIDDCLVYYRQHEDNHIGTNKTLDKTKLTLGIKVKKNHYQYFSKYNQDFALLYDRVCGLEQYVKNNMDKYIRIINMNFNSDTLCWWENIKTLEEVKQWI